MNNHKINSHHKVSRGEVWVATHKHANNEFMNDGAREIGVSITFVKMKTQSN